MNYKHIGQIKTLDDLRLARLESTDWDIRSVFISLCGSLGFNDELWLPPGDDYRGLLGTQPIVVYLSHQQQRADEVMRKTQLCLPHGGDVLWWCLDEGRSGTLLSTGINLECSFKNGVFFDRRQIDVFEGLAA